MTKCSGNGLVKQAGYNFEQLLQYVTRMGRPVSKILVDMTYPLLDKVFPFLFKIFAYDLETLPDGASYGKHAGTHSHRRKQSPTLKGSSALHPVVI